MSNTSLIKESARSRRLARRQSKHDVIRGGMPGGRYKPLSDCELIRIHQTALAILEEIGMGNATPDIIEITTAKGAFVSNQGRLCFPKGLIEDLIDKANKDFILHARNPQYDAHIKDGSVYFRTAGEAVNVLDYESRRTRPSTLVDVYDCARLADQLSNIHTFGQTVVATEYSHDIYAQDMSVLYAQISGTQKHTAVSTATADHIDAYVKMLDLVAGGEGEFVKRPFVLFGGCPVVSPLRFGTENAEVLVRCAQLGIPYDIAVASQAGATAPAALAGSLAQTFAETLAAMAVVHMINPTSPFLMGSWPFISDLRTGSFTGGSGEQALVSAASAQLINFYGLPSSLSACMTDSKLPDNQAGYEKAITATLVAHAGGNYIGEAFGMLGSLMACSFEAMIIDNDMVGNILRTVRGIEVNDDTLSLETIRETVNGAGHFLGHTQTLQLMESEYLYPEIADRSSYGQWEKNGKKEALDQAHEKVKDLLSTHYPIYIDPKVDEKIRASFPIMLKKEDMQVGNNRWN